MGCGAMNILHVVKSLFSIAIFKFIFLHNLCVTIVFVDADEKSSEMEIHWKQENHARYEYTKVGLIEYVHSTNLATSRENLPSGFATRYDSNRPAQLLKLARILNFGFSKYRYYTI